MGLSEEQIRRLKRYEAAAAREKEARLEKEEMMKEQQVEDERLKRLADAHDAAPMLKKHIASPPLLALEAPAPEKAVEDTDLDGEGMEECGEEEIGGDDDVIVEPAPLRKPALRVKLTAPVPEIAAVETPPEAPVPGEAAPGSNEASPASGHAPSSGGSLGKEEKINSSTHKRAWMHLGRMVETNYKTLPAMAKLGMGPTRTLGLSTVFQQIFELLALVLFKVGFHLLWELCHLHHLRSAINCCESSSRTGKIFKQLKPLWC